MSNVKKHQRNLGELTVYNEANKLRHGLFKLVARDFGVRAEVRDIKFFKTINEMTDNDYDTVQNILMKYNLGNRCFSEYPYFVMEDRQRVFLNLGRALVHQIRKANAIFPSSYEDFIQRRQAMNEAIATVTMIQEELQFTMEELKSEAKVNANNFVLLAEKADLVYALLKAWRKSDNKHKKKFELLETFPPCDPRKETQKVSNEVEVKS